MAILGVLAGIAVPHFLGYREKAWVAALQSAMGIGATAQQAVLSRHGAYTDDAATLHDDGGWRRAPGVSLMAGTTVGDASYCLEGTHVRLPTDHPWKVTHGSSLRGTFGQGPGRVRQR